MQQYGSCYATVVIRLSQLFEALKHRSLKNNILTSKLRSFKASKTFDDSKIPSKLRIFEFLRSLRSE